MRLNRVGEIHHRPVMGIHARKRAKYLISIANPISLRYYQRIFNNAVLEYRSFYPGPQDPLKFILDLKYEWNPLNNTANESQLGQFAWDLFCEELYLGMIETPAVILQRFVDRQRAQHATR